MPQYQTFPGAPGDSRSVDKLKALHLPVLQGRSFLDVGCNEGFFCGFARFAGAARSVGLDRSRVYIKRAQARFPDCEFHCQGWDCLPDGPFDVILLASALHYADDQPALLRRLVDHLAPDGVLVLELGLVSSRKSEWVKVTRGIDERWFPSMLKLREILSDYAPKAMGPSVMQAGDPVPRYVVHVSRRRPVAWLLMQPSTWGKTTLAKSLFVRAGVNLISGDVQIKRIAKGDIDVSPALRQLVAEEFSIYFISRTVENVFAKGLGQDLVATWLAAANGLDFALDGYIPAAFHEEVRRQLIEAGYLPVVLDWDRPGQTLYSGVDLARDADAFVRSMAKDGKPMVVGAPVTRRAEGFVDSIRVDSAAGRVVIAGWARLDDHTMPEALAVRLQGRIITVDHFDTVVREDARRRLGASHNRLGFRFVLDVDGIRKPADLGDEFSVSPVGGRPLRFTAGVARLLGRKETET